MPTLLDLLALRYPFSVGAIVSPPPPSPPASPPPFTSLSPPSAGSLLVSRDFNVPTAIFDQLSQAPSQQGFETITLDAAIRNLNTPVSDEVSSAKETPEQYGVTAAQAVLVDEMSRTPSF